MTITDTENLIIGTFPMLENTKILVVDYDEPDLEILIKQTFRKKIQSKELEFIFAHSALSALDALSKDPSIEIVLADVKLQYAEGIDFFANLSTPKKLLKTIVITPYGDIESIRTAMNRGAFDFVTRPINLQDIDLAITKTIEQVKKLREAEKVQNKLLDIEKELDVAKSIQNSILPHEFNAFKGSDKVDLYGTMLPAKRVGGDFFDFFLIDDSQIAFTIADVSGKGVPAALFMTMTRGLIRALGQKTKSPLQCFMQLNELIALENDSSMFVTAFYGIYNIQTREIQYCNAGHNPPYLVSSGGELKQIARCEGVALGVVKEGDFFTQNSLILKPDDTFLLYTDGVTEAMNTKNELFQEARFEAILKQNAHMPLKDLLEKIVLDVKKFSENREQSDDITLFGIRPKI